VALSIFRSVDFVRRPTFRKSRQGKALRRKRWRAISNRTNESIMDTITPLYFPLMSCDGRFLVAFPRCMFQGFSASCKQEEEVVGTLYFVQ
jgi:hypothetical protein